MEKASKAVVEAIKDGRKLSQRDELLLIKASGKRLDLDKFGFARTRELLADVKGNFSDAVEKERNNQE